MSTTPLPINNSNHDEPAGREGKGIEVSQAPNNQINEIKSEVILQMPPAANETPLIKTSSSAASSNAFRDPATNPSPPPSASNFSNATPVATRTRLSEDEKLQLLRLCVQRGEEYCGRREEFWARRTEEMNALLSHGRSHNQGRTISNARTVVSNMLKKYELEFPEGEKSVLPESDLSQALRAWKDWVDRSNSDKWVRRGTMDHDETQIPLSLTVGSLDPEKVLMTTTPVPASKKRIFEEAAVAHKNDDDTEKAQKEKKRKLRDRSDYCDDDHYKNGNEMIGLVKELVSHIVGKRDEKGHDRGPPSEAATAESTNGKLFEREIVMRLTRLERDMAAIHDAILETRKENQTNFAEVLKYLRNGHGNQ